MHQPTFIDLFCGCGGFSLGLERAGFRGLAALDFNPQAIEVFRANFPEISHVLKKDLTEFSPAALESKIGTNRVDLIVGGPPCQGFSTARQVDGANHGERLKEDPRRHLYKEFLKFVDHFRPKVFVMENVLGIRSASGGQYFTRVQAEARELGYRVHAQIEQCVRLGVPQKRRRQLFIGTREDLPGYFHPKLEKPDRAVDAATLWEAIGDLPPLESGQGVEEQPYDLERLEHARSDARKAKFLDEVLEIGRAKALTAHRARPHSDRDLRDFAKIGEGENSATAMRNGVEFEFTYDKTVFKDRYTRQHRDRPCSTIVAHLSKDGLMFIHPTQNRSLTPREAARVQSFPDWFRFPVARTHQFRVIGNAVPPLVGEAVGIAVRNYLNDTMKTSARIKYFIEPLPIDEKQATEWLLLLVSASDSKTLRRVSGDDFKKGWYSVGFLYPRLHPDGALEHGTKISTKIAHPLKVRMTDPRLIAPYFVRSGWPLVLAPIAEEAWRRFEADDLRDAEFYCSEAVVAGMVHRDPSLAQGVREERE